MAYSKVIKEANPYFNLLRMERVEEVPKTRTRFVIEPLPRGYGVTLGNSLRRVLLSSVPGYAVTHVVIAGVPHEFSSLDGILEDTAELTFNLRKIKVKLIPPAKEATLRLKVQGERTVTAADFEPNPEIEIINPDGSYLCTLTDKKRTLELSCTVRGGVGFVLAQDLKHKDAPIGEIALDSNFSPVERVAFLVENTRVGKETDFERLIITVHTNGAKTPDEAMAQASAQLHSYYGWFTDEQHRLLGIEAEPEVDEELQKKLAMPIEELGLSARAENCLKSAKVLTVGELVKHTAERLMSIQNFGEKSLVDIVDKLAEIGLFLAEKEE